MMLLQAGGVEHQFAEKVLEITPATMAGYGLALLVCIAVALVFYRRWQASDEYNRQIQSKVMAFQSELLQAMVRIQIRLDDQQAFGATIQTNARTLEDLRQDIGKLSDKLERITN